RQSTLLMDKHRQMAIKVVHLSIPLLKGDLRIDVRDSCRKDRQLYLWHAQIVATFGQKKQPSSPSSTRAKPSHLSSSSCLSAGREGSGVLKLEKIRIDKCPFFNLPAVGRSRWDQGLTAAEMRRCHWVKPTMVCQIKFTEWTRDDRLRQPVGSNSLMSLWILPSPPAQRFLVDHPPQL